MNKLIAIAAIAISLTGCMTLPANPNAPSIPKDTNLIIQRNWRLVAAACPSQILDGDQVVATVKNGDTVFVTLTPGQHILRLNFFSPLFGQQSILDTTTVDISSHVQKISIDLVRDRFVLVKDYAQVLEIDRK